MYFMYVKARQFYINELTMQTVYLRPSLFDSNAKYGLQKVTLSASSNGLENFSFKTDSIQT